MNIYQRKFYWKIILLLIAVVAIALSLLYNNKLAGDLADEERKKVDMIAAGIGDLQEADGDYQAYLVNVLSQNTTIPIILVDDGGVIRSNKNCGLENDQVKSTEDSLFLVNKLEEMRQLYEPITFTISNNKKNYVYYQDSNLLSKLKAYPYYQMGIIGAFLLLSYLAFSWARRAEQNQVWVGMARETAHQIGTPLSSLMAWTELLIENENKNVSTIGGEMNRDIARLDLIADRFSKIGSAPKLVEEELISALEKTYNYVKRRASSKIKFTNNFNDFEDEAGINVPFSPPLLDWVVENLLKNALDAMDGTGKIRVEVKLLAAEVQIDVSDTGKGISRANFTTVFQPGYSSKKRGWGLGLSLSKRIVEQYHGGKILVHKSTPGEGTTFRIVLPLVSKN